MFRVRTHRPSGHKDDHRSISRHSGFDVDADGSEKADFLASRDTWFRPASLRTGPNGALYLADMYRMWVEHPKFLPENAARIDWREGEDKGRIWRIVPTENPKPSQQFTPPKSNRDLVELLNDGNGWRRQMARQRLVESEDRNVSTLLRELLKAKETSLQGRVNAIWCLHGRGEVECRDITRAFDFKNATQRDQAIRLQMKMCEGQPKRFAMSVAAQSSDPSLRFQAVLECRHEDQETTNREWSEVLSRVSMHDRKNSWLQDALLIASGNRPQGLLHVTSRVGPRNPGKLRSAPDFDAGESQFLFRIAQLVGKSGGKVEISKAVHDAEWAIGRGRPWMTAAILKRSCQRHAVEQKQGNTRVTGRISKRPTGTGCGQLRENFSTVTATGRCGRRSFRSDIRPQSCHRNAGTAVPRRSDQSD